MGLLDLLPTSNLGLDGATPAVIPSANPASTLHFQSSINDTPNIDQSPSALDINGIKVNKTLNGKRTNYKEHRP